MSEYIQEWKETVLANYLKKNGPKAVNKTQIDHINDWMTSPEASRLLPRLSRISVPQAIEHADKWTSQLNKKAQITEDLSGVECVYTFPDGFNVVKILTKEAYGREGLLMGHCVASYFAKEDVEIYSLRDSYNNPHCTMELSKEVFNGTVKNVINQIKGKGNAGVVEKYQSHVLDFLKKSKVQIDEIDIHDLKNIGAHNAGRNIFKFDRQKDLVLELYGNINWTKELEYKKIRPHVLKIYGDFTLDGYETLSSYALVDELHVSGDLIVMDVDVLQRLANRVYVDGNVEFSNCLEMLKVGQEVYIGGSFNAEDCPELKCIASTGLVQEDVVVFDCEQFSKKLNLEIKGTVFIK